METTKRKRIAEDSISAEMRCMDVGEVVQFPISRYNYNSVRSTPSTLVKERIEEGKKWTTRINYDEKCVEVKRVS